MENNNFVTIFYPVFLTLLTSILTYLGSKVVKLIPLGIDLLVAHVGLTNYTKMKLVGLDIWNIIEEHFRLNEIIGDTVQAKITMFETLIKQKIPGITDVEINSVRQALAGEFNKDKPLIADAITKAEVAKAEATVKYFAPDGTELIPIQVATTAPNPSSITGILITDNKTI